MHTVAAKYAHSIARVFLPGEILFVLGGLGAFPQEHRHEIWPYGGRSSASPSPAAESQKDAQHPLASSDARMVGGANDRNLVAKHLRGYVSCRAASTEKARK
jgi:hypothetical protein